MTALDTLFLMALIINKGKWLLVAFLPKIKDEVGSTDVTAAFQNTTPDSPAMGVVLDNAPYIAMLAIVAIGGVALMLNKRRRDEE